MTSFTITGSTSAPQTLSGGEIGIVGVNGLLYSSSDDAITATSSNVVAVYGVVDAFGNAAINHSGGGTLDVNIGSSGSLHSASAGSSGIATIYSLAPASVNVNNAGTIQSDSFAALYFSNVGTASLAVNNSGTLQGDYGIYITGLDGVSEITNAGTVLGSRYGVYINSAAAGDAQFFNTGDVTGAQYSYRGGAGSDYVFNAGNMVGLIFLSDGDDVITNAGTVIGTIELGEGYDIFDGRGGHVSGEVRGGTGNDTYIVDSASTAIVEHASEGTDEVQSTVSFTIGANIENLELLGNDGVTGWGNYLANVINGNDAANVLRGMGGDDTIDGKDGDDLIYGGSGHDTIYGGNGDDRLYGGIDNDFLVGNDGNDNLLGEAGTDRLFGGDGNDSLLGGDNNDNLNGDAGADTLEGGSGFDRLVGGAGDDELTGNFNADTFIFNGNFDNDTITDFDANNDFEKIQLSGVSSIVDFADLVANHMTQVGSDVLIDAGGGNTITLLNVNIGDLDAVDFIF